MEKKDYQKQMEDTLNEISNKIDEYKRRAQEMSAESREKFQAQLRDLDAKKEAASKRLEEVRQASSEAWTHMRAGMDMAKDDLRFAYEKARQRLERVLH
jgi:DNA repair exonuclease SbcCD ATPase subunit